MTDAVDLMSKIGELYIPNQLKSILDSYCRELTVTFGEKILSITVIGSAATPDFMAGASDVNVLVILDETEIQDLLRAAPAVNREWKRHHISPRFISLRNLESAFRYFPIDFWSMRERHMTLHGKDFLQEAVFRQEDLRWQLHHEITGLRMRIKQQFWRVFRSVPHARSNLLVVFSSLLHLLRVLFHLKEMEIPESQEELIKQSRETLGIETGFLEEMLKIKQGGVRLRKEQIPSLYEKSLEALRRLSEAAGSV